MEQFNTKVVSEILDRSRENERAAVYEGNTQKPLGVYALTIALDTAQLSTKPYKLGFQFKSVYVQSATDSGVQVNLRPNTDDSFQGSVPLKLNDSFSFNFPVASAYLDWPAQSGKSITLIFLINADFRPGSTVSVSSGGVSINSGTAFTQTNLQVLTTATQLLAVSSTRKKGTVVNNSGASIWLGPAAVVAGSGVASGGLELVSGGSYEWTNGAALFGIAGAATSATGVLVMEET